MQDWQLVLIAWGEKYGPGDINGVYDCISRFATGLRRVTLLSDRPRVGLAPEIEVKPLPQEFLDPKLMRSGCQTKLAMFQKGVLAEDLPALYLDLDTVVLGDVARLFEACETPDEVAILQSALLPMGPIGRLAYRLTKGRRYGRGNSSAVVFHPAHCHYIAERFLELYRQYPDLTYHPMRADERFISWVAQPYMRAIPARLMVKFATEFMYRWLWLGYLRNALPWVRRRRAGLVAITLASPAVKPEILAHLPEGAKLQDHKGRKLLWSEGYIGPSWGALRNFFTADRA